MRPIATLTLLGAAALASTAASAASAASAPGLAPPVVKESYRPLPCPDSTPRTTLQMEGCAERQIVARDATITALNAKVFAAQRSAAAKRQFIDSNTRWLGYRTSFCETAGNRYAGGTERPVAVARCVATLDSEHITDLRRLLDVR